MSQEESEIRALIEEAMKEARQAREVAEEVRSLLTAIMEKIDGIQEQVGPAVNQLTESSVFRMLTGGKKK